MFVGVAHRSRQFVALTTRHASRLSRLLDTRLARVWLIGLADQAVQEATSNVEHAACLNHIFSLCNALAQAVCSIALLVEDFDIHSGTRRCSVATPREMPWTSGALMLIALMANSSSGAVAKIRAEPCPTNSLCGDAVRNERQYQTGPLVRLPRALCSPALSARHAVPVILRRT